MVSQYVPSFPSSQELSRVGSSPLRLKQGKGSEVYPQESYRLFSIPGCAGCADSYTSLMSPDLARRYRELRLCFAFRAFAMAL